MDATGMTLGRLSTVVASHLRGKHKPMFTTYEDTGDHVIVVNAEKVKLSVKGMLPKGSLGRAMGRKLKVYVGAKHPHEAQQPRPLAIPGAIRA